MRLRLAASIAAVVATGSALALVPPAQAHHSWGSYHWGRTTTEFSLELGYNVTGVWDAHLTSTVTDWNNMIDDPATVVVPSKVLTTVPSVGTTTGKRCRAAVGRVEVCNAAYGRNGWLGLAQIWLSGNHITQGTAKLNDTYFSMDRYNIPSERQHVMCQEVGHTFGLGHTSEDGSTQNTCMDYYHNTSAGDLTSTKPNGHDFEQLSSIYGHLDTVSTVGTTTAAASRQVVADDRASWGREVVRSANGHHATFVRDLGAGQRLVTHVTWADDPRGEHVPHTH